MTEGRGPSSSRRYDPGDMKSGQIKLPDQPV